jgi:hypothetical protein
MNTEAKAEKVSEAANRLLDIVDGMGLEPDEGAYALVMTAANYVNSEEGLEDLIKYMVFSYTMMEAVEDGRVKV